MLKNIIGIIAIITAIVLLPFISSYFSQKEYVEINREIKSTLFNSYEEKNLLIFFGYVGCADICTPRLQELSSVYEKLKDAKIETQVL
ncbi:MAG: SCO family protein, partial [Sulfurimonas sp.]|nr:SCO family protein [Sulfurimonas sp.]